MLRVSCLASACSSIGASPEESPIQESTNSVLTISSYFSQAYGDDFNATAICDNQGDDGGATEGGRTLVDPLGGICEGHIDDFVDEIR